MNDHSQRLAFAGIVALVLALIALTGCEPTTQPDTVKVTRIIDGDTLVVAGGATIRLIGIDTPERGQPCYRQARDHLAALIDDQAVTLTAAPGRDDHDKYGRLLRYVAASRTDVGLAQIRDGYAVARYDGLTRGYQPHPRQAEYRNTDATTPQRSCP